MSLMNGWQYTATDGGIEKHLSLKDDLPQPSSDNLSRDEVLIKTIYAGLNPADFKGAEGGFFTRLKLRLPATPGYDFCGRVQAVHPSNEHLKPGDLVFGNLGHPRTNGTLAQYFIAYQSYCVRVPEGLSLEDAVAIPSAGIAAYKSLAPYIKSGHKVFINGGSGGVGIFAIQIARILGAEVTVSCSTRNVEFCQGLGAQVIDYTKGDLITLLQEHGQLFDHVVDNVGTTPELYSHAHLFTKPEARIAQVGATTIKGIIYTQLVPAFLGGSQRPTSFVLGFPNREDLTLLGNWVAEGKIRINIDEKFAFEDVIKAFEKLKTGRVRGKIIVEPLLVTKGQQELAAKVQEALAPKDQQAPAPKDQQAPAAKWTVTSAENRDSVYKWTTWTIKGARKYDIVLHDLGGSSYVTNALNGSIQVDGIILCTSAAPRENIDESSSTRRLVKSHIDLIGFANEMKPQNYHLILAITKMDVPDWSQETFDKIITRCGKNFAHNNYHRDHVPVIPLSSRDGGNVLSSAKNAQWYGGWDKTGYGPKAHGYTLFEAIENQAYIAGLSN